MQHDDIIWDTIMYRNECTFRKRTITRNFCKNPYNLTGFCTRKACPLANSQYCTVREDEGKLYLYMKTIERAHMPNRLWERVKLSPKLDVALQQLAENLVYWPSYFQKKYARVRLVKLYQMINRIRRIRSDPDRVQYFAINRHRDKVESRRETKALRASQVNEAIRTELLNRLQSKTYGSLYDALTAKQKTKELSLRDNDDLQEGDLEESDVENFVEAYDDEEEDMDMEDMGEYEYEYEYENERAPRQRVQQKASAYESYDEDDEELGDELEEDTNDYAELDDDAGFAKLIAQSKQAAPTSSKTTKAKAVSSKTARSYDNDDEDDDAEEERKDSNQADSGMSVKEALNKLAVAPMKPVLKAPSKAPTTFVSTPAQDDEEEEEQVVVKKSGSSTSSSFAARAKARMSKK